MMVKSLSIMAWVIPIPLGLMLNKHHALKKEGRGIGI